MDKKKPGRSRAWRSFAGRSHAPKGYDRATLRTSAGRTLKIIAILPGVMPGNATAARNMRLRWLRA